MSILSKRVCQLKSSKSTHCKCSICDKETSQKGHLNEHIASVHKGDCSVCEKEFSSKSNMTSHIDKLHIEKTGLQCPLCQKEFAS